MEQNYLCTQKFMFDPLSSFFNLRTMLFIFLRNNISFYIVNNKYINIIILHRVSVELSTYQ